jgi:hypothetical protein
VEVPAISEPGEFPRRTRSAKQTPNNGRHPLPANLCGYPAPIVGPAPENTPNQAWFLGQTAFALTTPLWMATQTIAVNDAISINVVVAQSSGVPFSLVDETTLFRVASIAQQSPWFIQSQLTGLPSLESKSESSHPNPGGEVSMSEALKAGYLKTAGNEGRYDSGLVSAALPQPLKRSISGSMDGNGFPGGGIRVF